MGETDVSCFLATNSQKTTGVLRPSQKAVHLKKSSDADLSVGVELEKVRYDLDHCTHVLAAVKPDCSDECFDGRGHVPGRRRCNLSGRFVDVAV